MECAVTPRELVLASETGVTAGEAPRREATSADVADTRPAAATDAAPIVASILALP